MVHEKSYLGVSVQLHLESPVTMGHSWCI